MGWAVTVSPLLSTAWPLGHCPRGSSKHSLETTLKTSPQPLVFQMRKLRWGVGSREGVNPTFARAGFFPGRWPSRFELDMTGSPGAPLLTRLGSLYCTGMQDPEHESGVLQDLCGRSPGGPWLWGRA